MQILPPAERVLHFQETKSWFNSRHPSKVKEKYRKTEKELFDDEIVTETFHLIDRDHSSILNQHKLQDTIEMDELYSMLKKNNYPVNLGLLKAFFEMTDRDGNKCIDLDEFKQVIKDEGTSQTFRTLMRKMREIGEENYYSTDFVNLLRYLSYCANRTDLIWQIKNTRLSFEQRSKLVSELFKVNQQFTKISNPKDEQKCTLRPFMKTKGQGEIKYLTPINKKPRIITNLSTKTRISTSNQNSILSFDINSISSPRLSPLKTDRYVFKKKMSLTTTPSTKTTLYSTKSTQKINNKF